MEKDSYIENIQDEEEDFYSDDDLYNITSWGADLSFREIITMYEEEELLKPEIQRHYVWDKNEASRFIESILMGLPVPSIFLANKGTRKLIVDGFQRIMTIRDFVKGVFTKDGSVFKLSNTDRINQRWRGKTFEQLDEDDKRRIKSTTIHSIIFEQKEPKDSDTSMYQIFERINTGGRTLTTQEIRNCIYQGAFNKLLLELNRYDNWRKLYGKIEIDSRMRDVEFILRFLALDIKSIWQQTKGQISLKKHLNLFMGNKKSDDINILKEYESKFKRTIDFILKNIGLNAFHNIRIEEDGQLTDVDRFHPTIFDAIMIATYRVLDDEDKINKTNLNEKRIELLQDEKFINSISIRTTNIENIIGRVNLAKKFLYDL